MPKLGCRERSGPKLNTSVTVCVCGCGPVNSYHFFCQTLGPNRVRRLGHSSQKKNEAMAVGSNNLRPGKLPCSSLVGQARPWFCLCFRLSGPGMLLCLQPKIRWKVARANLRRNQRQRTHFSSIAVAHHGARKSFTADRFKKPIERLSVPARLLRGGGFHGLQPWHCARNMFQTRALAKPSVWFRGMKQGGALK